MKQKSFILSIIILMSACGGDTPKLLIDAEKMVDIVAEIKMSEAAVESDSEKMRDSITRLYARQILAHHGVSQPDFDSSLAVIHRNEKFMKVFLENVVRNLDKRRADDSTKTQ